MSDEVWAQRFRVFAEICLPVRRARLKFTGPYRWGAEDGPGVSTYIPTQLPPKEHLVFFLGVEDPPMGLHSSTLVLIDERGPERLLVTSAGDEG